MTKKLAKTLNVVETNIKKVEKKLEKKKEDSNVKEKDKEDKIKQEKEDEVSEIFSKETALYKNLKEDNDYLRDKSIEVLNHITMLIDAMMSSMVVNISAEDIKAFASVLRSFNDISNSLAGRNADIYKYEIDIFKEKMQILEDFVNKNMNEDGTPCNTNGSKAPLNEIIDKLKELKK